MDTVFFDAGGTILRVEPSVGHIYAAAAAEHGFRVSSEDLHRRFRLAWKQSRVRSRDRGFRCSDGILQEEWFEIVRDTFGESVPAAAIQALFDDLYARFLSAGVWRLAPGARAAIAYLRERGVKVGLLSNWDSRLRRMLAELEIDRAFDPIVLSHEVGFEKPHPEIFREALRQAGSQAPRTLHVGDSFEADILPARALGLRALWVAPAAERAGEPQAGAGVDSLPADPHPFWEEILSGDGFVPG